MMSRKRKVISIILFVAILYAALVNTGCEPPFETELLQSVRDTIAGDAPLAPSAPAAPSNLQATAVSQTQIDLTWVDNSDNEDEFQIQRKKANSEDWQTITVGADSTAFPDKVLDPNTGYVYRVRAANSGGESAWTVEVGAETDAVLTYSVTYDGNGHDGGTVPVDSNEYIPGSTVTVFGNSGSLFKNAYDFVGWNTEQDGTGTRNSAGGTFVIGSSDVTLYAEWSQNVHSITFNKNDTDATGIMADQEIPEGDTSPLSACGFIKSGWAFIGWSTTPGGSVEYADGANYTMGASDVTLYAQWSQNTHTLTFDKNDPDATGSMSNLNIPDGDTIALPACAFSKAVWVFAGWSTTPGGSVQYADEADYTMGSTDDILYAQWDPTFTVSYLGNGATEGDPPVDAGRYEEGEIVTVYGQNTLAKTGYTFAGWNTEADGTGIARDSGDFFPMPAEHVTLYAQWDEASFSVGYYGNDYDGGVVPSGGDYIYNETVTVENQGSMSRTGYSFTGWNTEADGSGISYSGGDTFSMPANDVNLYAQWSVNNYTVTYNGNGNYGGSVPSVQNVTYNTEVKVRDNTGSLHKTASPSSTGELQESFKYIGWNTQADGNGTHYEAGSGSFTVTEDITLYAEWGGYQLRDQGPSGGLIFYKKLSFSNGWRYMEAAPQSTEWIQKEWGAYGTDINGDGGAPELTGIGDGQSNTNAIILHVLSEDAAKLCYNLTFDNNSITFDDWFLPSKDELNGMYNELHDQPTPLGGFASDRYYWSSSEYSDISAMLQNFADGTQQNAEKNFSFGSVRAARAF